MTWMKRLGGLLVVAGLGLAGCAGTANDRDGERRAVIAAIDQVNTRWMATKPAQENAFWDVATYHTGNIEAYRVTGDKRYLAYTQAWAEHNQWQGAKGTDKSRWKYSYGETDDYVLFGDWQTCFQVYADLYLLDKDPRKIARAREVMEYQMATPQNDYLWWADGLYMVMPVMTKLYNITGNRQYLDKLHSYYSYANSIMYDPAEKLYYRDAKYVYPKHKSVNGKKDFWARGDGWVFAALARVLAELPADAPHRAEYEQRFRDMAQALLPLQQPDGYWTRSLMDPAHAPGPETSGTAFFTYGLAWGIQAGVLDRPAYEPAVRKGWTALTRAVHADGKVGYVQPVSDRPNEVSYDDTQFYGVGAFILAATAVADLDLRAGKNKP